MSEAHTNNLPPPLFIVMSYWLVSLPSNKITKKTERDNLKETDGYIEFTCNTYLQYPTDRAGFGDK